MAALLRAAAARSVAAATEADPAENGQPNAEGGNQRIFHITSVNVRHVAVDGHVPHLYVPWTRRA